MSERLHGWRRPVAITATILGAAACSGTSTEASPGSTHKPAASAVAHRRVAPAIGQLPNIKVTYFSNGTRELQMEDINGTTNDDSGLQRNVQDVYQFCDDGNLYSEIESYYLSSGGSLTVIPNASVCADGKLTSSDFPHSPDETVVGP